MGFEYKYTLEDMFRGAIETCREKGLIPYSRTENADLQEKETLPNVVEVIENGSHPNSKENGTK